MGIRKADEPSLRLQINNSPVTVYFSQQETKDTKGRVRDILTSAYEERFQRILSNNDFSSKSK